MNEILITAKKELENCTTTGDIRKLSAQLFKGIKDKSIDYVFAACHELLEQRSWALGVIAFDFAYRMKNQYDEGTFSVFEYLLKHKTVMPRVSYRYALQKMDKEKKKILMQ